MSSGERSTKWEQLKQLFSSIFAAKDEEILCSEFFERLPRFVDLQLSGEDAVALLPKVNHHLGQCPECYEVYIALLEAARSEGGSRNPSTGSSQP